MLSATFWKEKKGWFYKIVGQPKIYGPFRAEQIAKSDYLYQH